VLRGLKVKENEDELRALIIVQANITVRPVIV